MSKVYLGLGSNLGNRCQNIKKAVFYINNIGFTSVERISSFYFSPAQDWAGGDFVNAVARIYTLLDPLALLVRLETIERLLGRRRKATYEPRAIDIDILLYDDVEVDIPGIKIPHPRMWSRDFVLLPLKEIAPEYRDKINFHLRQLCRL